MKIKPGIFCWISCCLMGLALADCSLDGGIDTPPANFQLEEAQSVLESMVNQYWSLNGPENGAATAMSGLVSCSSQLTPLTYTIGSPSKADVRLIDDQSIFQIGSITKLYIAVVILQLARQQGFSLDVTLGELTPQLAMQYPRWQNITLRELLNMTSGIPEYIDRISFLPYYFSAPYTYFTPQALLNSEKNLNLQFTPGYGWASSTTNYLLLGEVIRSLTGHSPQQEVSARIINKLALKNTFFPLNAPNQVVDSQRMVFGYFGVSNQWPHQYARFEIKPSYSLSYLNSAGGIISTPKDLELFLQALFSQDKLLKREELYQLVTPYSLQNGIELTYPMTAGQAAFGLGLKIIAQDKPAAPSPIYTYTGHAFGFTATYLYDPRTTASMILMINSSSSGFSSLDVIDNAFSHLLEVCQQAAAQ